MKSIKTSRWRVYRGDCLAVLPTLRQGSVTLVVADLPYGVTQNKWDTPIDSTALWQGLNYVCTDAAAMVFTASEPFASALVMSNVKNFKYDLIWEKTVASGQLNVKTRPMRTHENILVFYRKKPQYHEQVLPGQPYSIVRTGNYVKGNYGKQQPSRKDNPGFRHARSVLQVSNPRIKAGHPTQKPVPLLAWLVRSYSSENDIVLDCCMGSGSTGIACLQEKRRFIGIELDRHWFTVAAKRLTTYMEKDT